jgi:hypothetical protein
MAHRRSLSVHSKLLGSFVILTVLGIVAVTAVGYVTARDRSTARAERQRLGLQHSKAGIVNADVLLRPDTMQKLFEASSTLARDTGRVLDVRRRAMQSARIALRRH